MECLIKNKNRHTIFPARYRGALYTSTIWRWMFWVELLPACLFLIALFFIPESPRYLIMAGKKDAAARVLSSLYGAETAALKLNEIAESLAGDKHQPKLSDLIDKSKKRLRPIVWIGIGLATFQQLVGINVVFYYGAVLWQAAGFTESDELLINIISAYSHDFDHRFSSALIA